MKRYGPSLLLSITMQAFIILGLCNWAKAQLMPGDAIVIDSDDGTINLGALFSVDLVPGPTFGDRTLISDFGNATQGPLGSGPFDVTLDGSGNALVIDPDVGMGGLGALFSVDLVPGPTFGDRTLISDFGNAAQGSFGGDPFGITLDGSGNALVIDISAGTGARGALFSVDLVPGPSFGDRTLISDFGNVAQGPLGVSPFDVTLDGSGNALVIDPDVGTGVRGTLFSVDLVPGPTFGDRTLISDFGNAAQGPLGVNPFGVAIVPVEQLASLGPATFWIGLKNSDDQGTQFDLRTEVYINGTLVAEGETRCITGVTRNANKAKEVSVEFGPISDGVLASGDELSLKVLTRIGTNPDDTKCSGPGGSHNNAVGLRLYYDAVSRPSRFGAEIIPDPLTDFFLHSIDADLFLDATSPTATSAKFKDSSAVNFAGGNPWKEIGTWSMTLP